MTRIKLTAKTQRAKHDIKLRGEYWQVKRKRGTMLELVNRTGTMLVSTIASEYDAEVIN